MSEADYPARSEDPIHRDVLEYHGIEHGDPLRFTGDDELVGEGVHTLGSDGPWDDVCASPILFSEEGDGVLMTTDTLNGWLLAGKLEAA